MTNSDFRRVNGINIQREVKRLGEGCRIVQLELLHSGYEEMIAAVQQAFHDGYIVLYEGFINSTTPLYLPKEKRPTA